MIDPTRNEVAHYRTATSRTDLLREVREWLDALPHGDLATAQHALAFIRGAATRLDLRYAAGRFYVLGTDALWTCDDERDSLTRQLLQTWADASAREVDTFDRELCAAHEADSRDGSDGGAFGDSYAIVRKWFDKAGRAWVNRVQSGAVRDRIIQDLHTMSGVLLPSPDSFDADPDSLAVGNGIVNLRTGELRTLRASDHATQRVDVQYDPDASAPLWTEFLDSILVDANGNPDAELIAWLRRMVGYGITGHAREQVFAVFHGSGANGKSVLSETLADLFESISRTAGMSTFEIKQGGGASGDIARLNGARLVFASEGEVGKRISAATVKRITGEDRITARHLYRPEFEFRPRFLLIMASNVKAPVIDSSEGYWRRLRVVPFRRYFAPHERDASLRNRLRNEFPGILRWAIEGARDWYAFGLGSTHTVDSETEGYRQEMDQLGEFMADRVSTTGEYADVVSAKDIWLAYHEWAGDIRDDGLLGRKTMLAAFGERKGIMPATLGGRRVYRGARLLTVTERTRAEHLAAKAG